MALPVVKVSSGYFPVLECISYNMQEGLRVSRQGLQSIFSSVGLHIIQLRKKEIVALAVVRVAVSIFQFWVVYHTVARGRDRGSPCG